MLGECQGACALLCFHLFVRIFFVSPAFNIQAATCHMGGGGGGLSYDVTVIVIVIASDQRHIVVQINTRLQSGFELVVSVL